MALARLGVVSCVALALGLAPAMAKAPRLPPPPRNTPELARLNAQAMALDPMTYGYVQPVCTRCHDPDRFLHSRTTAEWDNIFRRMKGYGARATVKQWDRIHDYFRRNLTWIDVNRADEDELSGVLGVGDETAIAIVRRRADRRFVNAADLESVPGVDAAVIEAMKPRLVFVAGAKSG